MAKIAIVSDVHLGTRQYGLTERYHDFHQAFLNLEQNVVQRRPNAVVIGGDLFDSTKPDAHSVALAQNVVHRLKSHDIQVLGIDGNHDLSNGGWLNVIGAYPLADAPLEIYGLNIIGLDYRNGRDLIAAIQDMVDRGVKADILVAHFALAEMNGGGTADTGVQEICPLLEKMGVKCVLMGHIHIPEAKKWNGILFVNPGSTEMKSSNEPRDKYYFMLDTDTWEAEPIRIPTRKVESMEIVDEVTFDTFRNTLEEEARQNLSQVERPFYQVIADDSIEDCFNRLSKIVHDTSAMARIVMRSNKSRDLAPVVDRKEGVATLESAIEARFPKESQEARLTTSFLHSPEPAAIHMVVDKFMNGESGQS